ncbi:DinB family protein [Streptomyces sp. NPDC052012]|uniref:DinB family protein n=1 Tax=Streptomyces sp. NPDC052012 TaxID=3155051 RepID=UPI00344E195D
MSEPNAQADLLRYLQEARDALLWKLEGLSEYDVRRPLTPTGTNLLGLVKHLARVELGYFGDTFGRPFFDKERPPAWYVDDAEANSDMWATPDETREEIVGLYRQAWAHTDATVAALGPDAIGRVPWWPEERRETTLHHILVRVLSDTQRHAGQADIVRELIDGSVGALPGNTSLPPGDREWWHAHRDRVERAAREADAAG